jgi:CHAT domain-containing protein
LVQESVTIEDARAAMGPHEAVAAIVLGDTEGWTFLIRRDSIEVGTIEGGAGTVDPLVKRIRASVEPDANNRVRPFDTEAAHALYRAVLGPVEATLNGATQINVAASGSLLSIPFTLLLTAPHNEAPLARAPFLVRRYAVSHVPSVGGFVNLRKAARTVRASRPWFGLGEFRPPSPRQAAATYPPEACGDNARIFASLGALPGAKRELDAARVITGAGPDDIMVGAGFTVRRVQEAPLAQYRVLHFATHALLPSELRCQAEPAVLTSTQADAPDASGALLTASRIEQMTLDAELVILAACNTGGGDGSGAGESLSGLARSFFFAGARALMVTHWEANDLTTTYLTALFLQGQSANPSAGAAANLAAAQRRMLDESVDARAAQAHPTYWAVGALIGGDGERL